MPLELGEDRFMLLKFLCLPADTNRASGQGYIGPTRPHAVTPDRGIFRRMRVPANAHAHALYTCHADL